MRVSLATLTDWYDAAAAAVGGGGGTGDQSGGCCEMAMKRAKRGKSWPCGGGTCWAGLPSSALCQLDWSGGARGCEAPVEIKKNIK